MNSRLLTTIVLSTSLLVFGCSGDGDGTGGTGGGAAGAGGSGATAGSGGAGGTVPKGCADIPDTTNYIVPNAPPTSSDDCGETLTATGDNDQAQIFDAILEVGSNGVVCFNAGDYDMGGTIDVTTTPGLTLKGIGDSPDDVVLDYADDAGDCRGSVGINVSVDNVTVENMWVKNTCENAVVQRNVDGSVFRKVRVSWDGEPRVENGAYGIYPTDCSNTLVEYCQTQGASDAGIYIGKCDGGLVQNNVIYENVAGLEVENSQSVDVSGNEIFDNTGGLLALQQDISGDMQSNGNVRMFDSEVYCNNRENFAQPGSAVSGIPVGTGGLSFAGNGVEFFGNQFTDNLAFGLGMAANVLTCQVSTSDCPPYSDGYDPWVSNVYIHDNTWTNNGTNPTGDFGALFNQLGLGLNACDAGDNADDPCNTDEECPGGACVPDGPPVPDVVWDGYTRLECDGDSDNPGDQCFSNIMLACDGGDNDGEPCETDGDCSNGICTNVWCPNGACAPAGLDPGVCVGTDAAAAPSTLVIGDPCQDLGLGLLEYIGCAKDNSEIDSASLLCAP